MSVKDDKIDQFIAAMFSLTNAMESDFELCCKICGGINKKELMIIAFVGDNKSAKMSEIADYLKAPLSTLTSIADKLVANKFLVRYNSDEDRRVVKVALGEKGLESYKAFLTRKKSVTKKVLSYFNEKEQSTLINHINKLAGAIVSPK
jgi:DNA-binding MarR family transcriptional regulator